MNQSQGLPCNRSLQPVPRPHAAAPALEYAAYQTPEAGTESALDEIWTVLWRRKYLLALLSFAGLALGIASLFVLTPVYRARTVLEIEGLNDNYLNLKDLAATAPGSPYGAEAYVQTQIKILKSESLAARVAEKLRLAERPEFAHRKEGLLDKVERLARIAPAPSATQDKLLAAISTKLNVTAPLQSRVVDITFDAKDRALAAETANAFAQEYIAQSMEARSAAMERTRDWLGKEVAALKAKIEQQNNRTEKFAQASGLIVTTDSTNLGEARLRELQTEVSRAQAERAVRQSRYETATKRSIESAAQALDSETLRQYSVNLANLRRQLAEDSVSLAPAHYKIQKLQAQIAEVEATVARERTKILSGIRDEYEAARGREELLLRAYARQADDVAKLSANANRYGVMKRESQTAQQLYDSMMQKSMEASVALALRSTNVRVVDPARPPVYPYSPNPALNGAMGLLGGFALGLVLALCGAGTDRTLKKPGDLTRAVDLPELGAIPSAKLRAMLHNGRHSVLRIGGPPKESLELATWHSGASAFGDSFRSSLASILFSSPDSTPPGTLVVTSLNSGEGKTTVLTNLGIALAETGRRTVLIDGDLRRPRLHNIFELCNSWGLTDLLSGDQPIDSLPDDALSKATHIPGLHVLMAGPGAASVANLLYSPRMNELLTRLRQDFTHVLIDSPPMMQFPDSRMFGRLADGLVLVVRASRTTREQIEMAYTRLVADHIPMVGTILNDCSPSHLADGSGYYNAASPRYGRPEL